MPSYPTHSKYFHTLWESYWHGDVAVAYQLLMNEHSGTHVDAPAHFMRPESGPAHVWIDEVEPTALMGPAMKIDLSDRVPERGLVDSTMIEAWEAEHRPITEGSIVLFRFGWDLKWAPRPNGNAYVANWPGLAKSGAELLVRRGVKAVGTDAISLDADQNQEFPAHYTLLSRRILIIENLASLHRLPEEFLFLAAPLRIRGGSGSPIRALALVPKSSE